MKNADPATRTEFEGRPALWYAKRAVPELFPGYLVAQLVVDEGEQVTWYYEAFEEVAPDVLLERRSTGTLQRRDWESEWERARPD